MGVVGVSGASGAVVAAYRELLSDPAQAEALGSAARERALDEHTYSHRAQRVLELVGAAAPAAAGTV